MEQRVFFKSKTLTFASLMAFLLAPKLVFGATSITFGRVLLVSVVCFYWEKKKRVK
jgi:hypothetical protein